ncbi:MAG TPA: protein kinase [Verrucomicrobiales bacterium]|nr:protein kinase [Verrucomicrobiales bacterium]
MAAAALTSDEPTAAVANTPGAKNPPPSLERVAAAFPQLEILELIGAGGMGAVFKARQTKLDRIVALKLLPENLAADPAFTGRFSREGRVLARLNHPNIVTVHDFGESGGFYYLLMEYVDGVNLRQAMLAGRFSPKEALSVVPEICNALQYAHEEGVLHRDIKPENILLDSRGRVKIADFGIAKMLGASGTASGLTLHGAALGTPHYMAPEQIERPDTVDHRADIYSLGVVFYELLTGELPLGRFSPPSSKSQVDARIDDIVLRALAKERELRQHSAGELRSEVETVTSKPAAGAAAPKNPVLEPTQTAAPGPASREPNPWIRRTLLLLAALLGFPVVAVLTLLFVPVLAKAGSIGFFELLILLIVASLPVVLLFAAGFLFNRRAGPRSLASPASALLVCLGLALPLAGLAVSRPLAAGQMHGQAAMSQAQHETSVLEQQIRELEHAGSFNEPPAEALRRHEEIAFLREEYQERSSALRRLERQAERDAFGRASPKILFGLSLALSGILLVGGSALGWRTLARSRTQPAPRPFHPGAWFAALLPPALAIVAAVSALILLPIQAGRWRNPAFAEAVGLSVAVLLSALLVAWLIRAVSRWRSGVAVAVGTGPQDAAPGFSPRRFIGCSLILLAFLAPLGWMAFATSQMERATSAQFREEQLRKEELARVRVHEAQALSELERISALPSGERAAVETVLTDMQRNFVNARRDVHRLESPSSPVFINSIRRKSPLDSLLPAFGAGLLLGCAGLFLIRKGRRPHGIPKTHTQTSPWPRTVFFIVLAVGVIPLLLIVLLTSSYLFWRSAASGAPAPEAEVALESVSLTEEALEITATCRVSRGFQVIAVAGGIDRDGSPAARHSEPLPAGPGTVRIPLPGSAPDSSSLANAYRKPAGRVLILHGLEDKAPLLILPAASPVEVYLQIVPRADAEPEPPAVGAPEVRQFPEAIEGPEPPPVSEQSDSPDP